MTDQSANDTARYIYHELESIFRENENSKRVHALVEGNVRDAIAAREAGLFLEPRGLAVLGRSGAGKTESVKHALAKLGYKQTRVGDPERPFVLVRLSANASLKALSSDCLSELGWRARRQDSARAIWAEALHYMRELQTKVLVLDEIQHVRTAGPSDRAALQDFLKSIVQSNQQLIVPIVVGMADFAEVLTSDAQLRRRFDQVHLRDLSSPEDRKEAIQVLDFYARKAGLTLDPSTMSREFAERLLHAASHAYGEMCALCIASIRVALKSGSETVKLHDFQEMFAKRTDCVPALNPFVAGEFQNIQPNDQAHDPTKRAD